MPPPAAIDPRTLCDGRTDGARVQMSVPGAETIAGSCRRGANGWLQFTPDRRR
ncbi:MAG: hypothetical protein ABWZ88_01330 [Variovorax sp.]